MTETLVIGLSGMFFHGALSTVDVCSIYSGLYNVENFFHRTSMSFPTEITSCYLGGRFRKGNEVFMDWNI